MKNIFTYKLNEIDKVSDIIISKLDKTNIILFDGEIGSGKTTIIKSILEKRMKILQVHFFNCK